MPDGMTIVDAMQIGVEAIDLASIAGKYARLDDRAQERVRQAQAVLSRTALDITMQAEAKGAKSNAPAAKKATKRSRKPAKKRGKKGK